MFEYSVELSDASSPEDMEFVVMSFRAGQKRQQDEIWNKLQILFSESDDLIISKKALENLIYG